MTTDRAELRAWLAEHVSVDDPICCGTGWWAVSGSMSQDKETRRRISDNANQTLGAEEILKRKGQGYGWEHPDCQGSGRRWLLRVDCPCRMTLGRIGGRRNPTVCDICHNKSGHDLERCTRCLGLDYVYNDAEDALTEAIRTLGFILVVEAYPNNKGNHVWLWQRMSESWSTTSCALIGTTYPKEGLQGNQAIEVALERAIAALELWQGPEARKVRSLNQDWQTRLNKEARP